jgi:hypothetical protein
MMGPPNLTVFVESEAQVEIQGSAAALRTLAEWLRTATSTATSIPVTSAGPELVRNISIRQGGTMVEIREASGVLFIEGASDKLNILADNVAYVASAGPECVHIHIEHFESHPYIDSRSIPLIISRAEALGM